MHYASVCCYIAKSLVFGKVNGFASMPRLLIRSITFVHETFHRSADPREVTLPLRLFMWYEVLGDFQGLLRDVGLVFIYSVTLYIIECRVSSGVPNTKKQMKALSLWPRALSWPGCYFLEVIFACAYVREFQEQSKKSLL